MPSHYPKEYTPEMSAQYLTGRIGEIEAYGRQDEGRAVAEMASRGLLGQAQYGSAVGQARAGTAREKSRTIGDFNLRLAGLKREERMTEEGREYQSSEAEKSREFQEKLAVMGYQFRRGEREAMQGYQRVQSQQGAVVGGLFGIASSVSGAAIGAAMGAGGGGGGGGYVPGEGGGVSQGGFRDPYRSSSSYGQIQ